jgi:hypothetical protein
MGLVSTRGVPKEGQGRAKIGSRIARLRVLFKQFKILQATDNIVLAGFLFSPFPHPHLFY